MSTRKFIYFLLCAHLSVHAHTTHVAPSLKIKTQTVAAPQSVCAGYHYVRWAKEGWEANTFTKTIELSHGLTMTNFVEDPNDILLTAYPKLYEGLPALYISSNSASKAITWTTEFNQTISGCHFSIYDIEQAGTLAEYVEVRGYNGFQEVRPTISRVGKSSLSAQRTVAAGQNSNAKMFGATGKINLSFTQSIDKIVITYKNNRNTVYPRGAMMVIGDFAIFCPEPGIPLELMESMTLSKIAPVGAVNKGDLVTYLFRFNNMDTKPQMVHFTDILPEGLTWLPNSFVSQLKGQANEYGGGRTFVMKDIKVPSGLSTFTIDAYVGAATGYYAQQAMFQVNDRLYLSDDPNQLGRSNATALLVGLPKPDAPLRITKTVSTPTAFNTDILTFTYIFKNTGSNTIFADFMDEIPVDTARYKISSLTFDTGIIGMENLYSNSSSLYINDLSIPIGMSRLSVQVELNGCSIGAYTNAAVVIPKARNGYRPIEIISNEVTCLVVPKPVFQFVTNKSHPALKNSFIANGNTNQMGYIQFNVTVLQGGKTTFNVKGAGISGSLTTMLTPNVNTLTIPVWYDGSGADGLRTLTITSEYQEKAYILEMPIEPVFKTAVARVNGY